MFPKKRKKVIVIDIGYCYLFMAAGVTLPQCCVQCVAIADDLKMLI